MSHLWFEVWADEEIPPYVLLVLCKADGVVVVFDPKDEKVAFEASRYEDVKLWLLEGEYRCVEGRMFADEP
jgi:hypothetical protein